MRAEYVRGMGVSLLDDQLCQSLKTLAKCSVRGASVRGLYWEEIKRVVKF